MVKCSAYECNNASYNKTPGLSFHRFPKENNLKKIWVQKINRKYWQPTSSSVLCSNHFESHLKDASAFCTILRPGAIPTLFEKHLENEQNLPTATVSSRKCAAGNIVSLMQDVKNIPEPQPCLAFNSNITVQIDVIQKIEDQEPDLSELERLKRKISLKNRKVRALQQRTRRLKRKLSKFTEIISNLKKKNQDVISILSSIPVKNKVLFTRFLKKAKGAALENITLQS